MSDDVTLVYLEADDEITTVVRRVRAAAAGRVVVVAPGRSRATSSAIALRLLARTGVDEGREVVVVGDALTRSLAGEAGLPAFASVDDARDAGLEAPPPTGERQHASIHVVRGAASDETVAAPIATAAATTRREIDETQAVPLTARARPAPARAAVPALAPAPARAAWLRRERLGLAALLAVAGALLAAGIMAGATLLPAATITITPRTEPVSATYEIVADEVVRHEGTVEATATVTASGSYEVVEAASGVVTFRNFNTDPVEVPAGTLVAGGEQAFETTEAVTVPSGSLTPVGTIAAGEADAPVVASAAGPAGNVEAEAIDTVLSQNVRARLRLFPQNNARLVINAEPTGGGVDATGPEFTEEDVAAAVEALRAELSRRAAEARPEVGELTVIETPAAEPRIEVPEDLAGTRDETEVEIGGSLDWQLVAVDLERVEAQAAERLATDGVVPPGTDLLAGSVAVDVGQPALTGDDVVVEATATGLVAARLDEGEVIERAAGRTAPEAEMALAELGDADVELWPDWVASVPELEWRVEVRIGAASR